MTGEMEQRHVTKGARVLRKALGFTAFSARVQLVCLVRYGPYLHVLGFFLGLVDLIK